MKNIYFLSGLPRSGSTVLAAILNQNPKIHTTATSGLIDMLVGTLKAWADSMAMQAIPDKIESEKEIRQILHAICEAKYENISKPIILDKARGWSNDMNIQTMAKVFGYKPKIIATVRNIPDCVASMVRVAKPDNLEEFLLNSPLVTHIKEAYVALHSGYLFAPECILFVDYDDLLNNPKKEVDRVHKFLEIEDFNYNINAIDAEHLRENDSEIWGVEGLHNVKPKLERQHNTNSKDVLGVFYPEYEQPRFWLNEIISDKPPHDLDLQLLASKVGDFSEGWRLVQKIEKEEPWNHRAAFNRGWYYLRQGQIQKGYQLMNRGRIANVFGNSRPDVPTEQWDGKSKGIVLLYLEGGLGDQIHQVRYAKYIAERGCKVIVSCTGQLASLFIDVEGVSSVVQHEAVYGVYHDFWVAGMSAVVPLGLELPDLDGSAYITKPSTIKGHKKRIGLRWQGNPYFEHEHYKSFPFNLMFDAVKNADAEFISLQRDEAVNAAPSWVKQVPLNTWEDTRDAIASCDLVISACTSVSHLSAAMGVDTWVVIPIMPYFLYAIDGEKTPYYDSMKLIRQEKFGKWESAFNKIEKELNNKSNKIRRIA
jgi:hypothetical protein